MNELKSYTEYAVSTPTADFVIGFDFNYGEDAVNVTVDDVPASEAGYTVVYLNETTIRLSPSVPSGIVRLQRETDIDQTDHAYRAGAKFIAQTMDENFEQLRHSQQEVRDGFSKLSTDTHEIIEGLDAALELAQDAAQDAQDAAVIAQGAADTVNTIIVGGKVGAGNVLDASGETQQQVNYNGGSKWHSRVGGYLENERAILSNGDIVKSIIDGNTNDPNADMTGWELADAALNTQKLNRENVSVWDFFTSSEHAAYQASPTTFDAYRPLQAFFDNIAVNNYGVAYCSGKFRTSQGIVFNVTGDSLNSTRTVIGELDVTCLNAIDTTFDFTLGQDFNWFGKVIARGQGGVSLNSRTCQTGIRITTSSRSYFHKLVARAYIGHGVFLPDGDTLLKIGEVRTSDCGSGHYDTGSQLTNFTATSKTGSASSVAQRQVITVNTLPKFSNDGFYNVLIDGQPYFVSATNRTTRELTIFPWLPTSTTGGSLKYLYGSGIAIYGGDSSEVIIDSIDCVRTGTAYINGALYSANVTVLQTQSCGVAMQFGSSPSSGTVGGVIQNMYCEANAIDILRCTRSEANFFIASDVSLDLSKTRYTSSPRDGSDNLITFNNLNGFTIFKNGVVQSRSTIGNLELTASQEPVLYGNNFTSNLTLDETILQSYPDLLVKKLLYIGAGANQQPTTGITINPPSGYTLNGLTSLSFTNLSRPLEVTLGLRLGTKSIIVTSNHIPMTSVTYDPPSIPSGGSVSTTVTLQGAALGQTVSAAFSRYNADIEITPIVSATDTVTIKFKNTGASAVDLASGTLTVKLI